MHGLYDIKEELESIYSGHHQHNWSFMHDQLSDGRNYRLFNIIDDYRREGLAIEAGFSLPAMRVIRILNQLIGWRGKPAVLRCDNGPEFISHTIK